MEITPFRRYLTGPFRGLQELEREFRSHPELAGFPFAGRAGNYWAPPVDVEEAGETVVVRIEMPGLRREEIRVTIEPGAVAVEGERQRERESTEGSVFLSERSYGSFFRRIPLPVEVEATGAEATLRDGILTIRARRAAPGSRSTIIPVETPAEDEGAR
ncbi:MAG: Hsp20/alpha crystallin family protein [Dehalococcoidia bacterium]